MAARYRRSGASSTSGSSSTLRLSLGMPLRNSVTGKEKVPPAEPRAQKTAERRRQTYVKPASTSAGFGSSRPSLQQRQTIARPSTGR